MGQLQAPSDGLRVFNELFMFLQGVKSLKGKFLQNLAFFKDKGTTGLIMTSLKIDWS